MSTAEPALRARRPPAENDYRELKQRVARLGLFEPQPLYYLRVFSMTFGLFFLPYSLLFFVDGYWWAVGLGVVAAFASGQVGLLCARRNRCDGQQQRPENCRTLHVRLRKPRGRFDGGNV